MSWWDKLIGSGQGENKQSPGSPRELAVSPPEQTVLSMVLKGCWMHDQHRWGIYNPNKFLSESMDYSFSNIWNIVQLMIKNK